MNASTHTTSFTNSVDPDLAEQAHEGHGIPSQDPDTSAQFPLRSEEANVAGAASHEELHLKTFVLEKEMLTMSGAFYPTGYIVVMFPNGQQAEQVAHELVSSGYDGEAIMLLRPETILREIGHEKEGTDLLDLPSVGTEEATMQRYMQLARKGHHGLMVHAASDKETERVMMAVRGQPFSYAQKYHMLAMEDLK